MSKVALARRANGGVTRQANGSAALVDPAANDCCCGRPCPSDTPCEHCAATPTTVALAVSLTTLDQAVCRSCGGRPWRVGTVDGSTWSKVLCADQVPGTPCTWRYARFPTIGGLTPISSVHVTAYRKAGEEGYHEDCHEEDVLCCFNYLTVELVVSEAGTTAIGRLTAVSTGECDEDFPDGFVLFVGFTAKKVCDEPTNPEDWTLEFATEGGCEEAAAGGLLLAVAGTLSTTRCCTPEVGTNPDPGCGTTPLVPPVSCYPTYQPEGGTLVGGTLRFAGVSTCSGCYSSPPVTFGAYYHKYQSGDINQTFTTLNAGGYIGHSFTGPVFHDYYNRTAGDGECPFGIGPDMECGNCEFDNTGIYDNACIVTLRCLDTVDTPADERGWWECFVLVKTDVHYLFYSTARLHEPADGVSPATLTFHNQLGACLSNTLGVTGTAGIAMGHGGTATVTFPPP